MNIQGVKESNKNECKILFYIQQNLDARHFGKFSNVTRSKDACDTLENYHDSGKYVKF